MKSLQKDMISSIISASNTITNTIKTEIANVNGNISNISAQLDTVMSGSEVLAANQRYTNKLLELNNERQNSIIRNQEFEQMLFTDPAVFGSRVITDKSYRKYH